MLPNNKIRKIKIKSFNINNISKPLYYKNRYPKIALTDESVIHTNIDKTSKSSQFRNNTQTNIMLNNSKTLLEKNIKYNLTNASLLSSKPIKQKIESKFILTKEKHLSESKEQKINSPRNYENKLSLSDIYKLPTLLKNNFNTLKLKLLHKKSYEQDNTQIIKEKTININSKLISPITNSLQSENSKIKDMKERINKGLNNANNNVNINIIDYNKICTKKNLRPISIINRISSSVDSKKVEYEPIENLQKYMKDRFYCDTESKMKKKLQHTVFNHDNSLKDKIIKMKKISGFWGGLADYCIPIFSIRKFECIKQRIRRQKNKRNKEKNIDEIEIKKIKNDIKPYRLFTINSLLDYKHQKNLENKKEFIEKYNDSLEYYMI